MDYTQSQQIGWHCRHALFQPDVLASQPFCLLQASQSFAFLFDVICPPTHSSVRWYGVVLQFLHALSSVHISSMMLLTKVATWITQEPGQDPKDKDVSLIQELGNCFSCLIEGSHTCHNMLHEMVLEHQDIGNSRQFVQLQGHLYAGKTYVQEVQWEQWAQFRCRGTLGKLPSCFKQCMHRTWWIAASEYSFLATRSTLCNNDRVWLWPWWPAFSVAAVQSSDSHNAP